MPKQMLFDAQAASKMKSGINQLAEAVKSTMGPHGKNVIISRDGRVAVTKDGASVAIEVDLEDPIENVAAQLVKQIAHKTALETGDGTTTATVLAEALYVKGLEKIEAGANAREVLTGMNSTISRVVDNLNSAAIKADKIEILKNIATISANGDTEIGYWIAQAFHEVGFDGLVLAQLSATPDSEFEVVKGLQFHSGYISPIFLTSEVPEIKYERPLIFLYDGKINAIKEIMPILEYSSTEKADKPIIIIAAGFDAALFPMISKMKASGLIRPVFIKTPINAMPSFYADLSIAIGGKLISAKNGSTLEMLKTSELIKQYVGSCERIVITEAETKVLDGGGSDEAINMYVAQLQEAIDSDSTTPSQKLILKERASRLSKGIAIIHVGGDSEIEQRERFDRVEDSIGATKAAIAEGYVQGGGIELCKIAASIRNEIEIGSKNDEIFKNSDFTKGVSAVADAITTPFITIVSNSGYNPKAVWDKVLETTKPNSGFNARTGEYVDLFQEGIIDPVKVTRRALENAASVATLILNSRCLMVKTTDKGSQPNFNMSL